MTEYRRTLPDELNWIQIEQLHNATRGLSKQSFEIKKICLTLEIATLTLIAKFLENNIDLSLFVAGLIIPVFFYLLDAMTYFYQDKLRGLMIKEENSIRARYQETEKDNPHNSKRLFRSFFNNSHWIYFALVVLDIALGFFLDVF
jgi:hypothetical protein